MYKIMMSIVADMQYFGSYFGCFKQMLFYVCKISVQI